MWLAIKKSPEARNGFGETKHNISPILFALHSKPRWDVVLGEEEEEVKKNMQKSIKS